MSAKGLSGKRVAAMRAGMTTIGFTEVFCSVARTALACKRAGRKNPAPRAYENGMSGDLKWNKIFGAALATGLVILGVREVSTRLYAQEEPEKMGYQIEVAETPEGGEPSGPALPPDWGTVLASADLAAGEAAFARCASCHKMDNGNGTGPGLMGVVGRGVASHAGFTYSAPMTEHRAESPTWTYDALDQFLTAPGKVVPGTKMSFAGLKKQEDRINLIAWMRTQGSTGYPIPAPDPSRQAPAPGAAPAAAAPAEGAAAQGGQAPVTGAAAAPTQQASPAAPPAGTPPPVKK